MWRSYFKYLIAIIHGFLLAAYGAYAQEEHHNDCVFSYKIHDNWQNLDFSNSTQSLHNCSVVTDEQNLPITWMLDQFVIFYLQGEHQDTPYYYALLYNSETKIITVALEGNPQKLNILGWGMYEPKTFAEFLTMPAIEKFPYAVHYSSISPYYNDNSDLAQGKIIAQPLGFEYIIQ